MEIFNHLETTNIFSDYLFFFFYMYLNLLQRFMKDYNRSLNNKVSKKTGTEIHETV